MPTFSPKARKAADISRRKKMALRAKLAEKYGGTTGEYFPSRIRATLLRREIPLANVPASLLEHTVETTNEIPLDSPIFDKPAKKPKAAKPKPESDRELVLKLLQLAVKFL